MDDKVLERRVGLAYDLAERLLVVLLGVTFLVNVLSHLQLRPQNILGAANEVVAAGAVLLRRRGSVKLTPFAVSIGLLGTMLPLMFRPGGEPLFLRAGVVLMLGGLTLSLISKLYLGRSFGLVAANRGVKAGGPYRFVRHPMYAGYILGEVGLLLLNPTAWNLVIYAAAWTVQGLRIGVEERTLLRDPAYRAFAEQVRWRLVPGVL